MTTSYRYIFLAVIALAVLVAVGAGAYFGYHYYMQHRALAYQQLMHEANDSIATGDTAGIIEDSTKALALASTAEEATVAKLTLAYGFFLRNQGTDRQEASNIYKAIIADPNSSPYYQATAYEELAYWYTSTGSDSLMRQLVFNAPPYSDYLAQGGGSVPAAVAKLYGLANALYPTALGDYELARWISNPLSSPATDTHSPAAISIATSTQQYVIAGDLALAKEATSSINVGRLSALYLSRAIALGNASHVLSDITRAEVNAAYEQSISAADTANSAQGREIGAIARFNYAVSLEKYYTDGSKNQTIETLLSRFVSDRSPDYDSYILSIQNRPSADPLRKEISALAVVSTEFAAYLTGIGWKSQ